MIQDEGSGRSFTAIQMLVLLVSHTAFDFSTGRRPNCGQIEAWKPVEV
jgi:hypothetical protein